MQWTIVRWGKHNKDNYIEVAVNGIIIETSPATNDTPLYAMPSILGCTAMGTK